MSANASSIAFDGNDLYDQKLVVVNRGRAYMPKPRLWMKPRSGANGVLVQGSTFDARYFRFDCMIAALSEANLDTYIDELIAIFETCQEGEKELILGWKPTYHYNVRMMSAFEPDVAGSSATFTLEFIAPNPVAVLNP